MLSRWSWPLMVCRVDNGVVVVVKRGISRRAAIFKHPTASRLTVTQLFDEPRVCQRYTSLPNWFVFAQCRPAARVFLQRRRPALAGQVSSVFQVRVDASGPRRSVRGRFNLLWWTFDERHANKQMRTCALYKIHKYVSPYLWPPYVADADIIFLPCGFFYLFYFLA